MVDVDLVWCVVVVLDFVGFDDQVVDGCWWFCWVVDFFVFVGVLYFMEEVFVIVLVDYLQVCLYVVDDEDYQVGVGDYQVEWQVDYFQYVVCVELGVLLCCLWVQGEEVFEDLLVYDGFVDQCYQYQYFGDVDDVQVDYVGVQVVVQGEEEFVVDCFWQWLVVYCVQLEDFEFVVVVWFLVGVLVGCLFVWWQYLLGMGIGGVLV